MRRASWILIGLALLGACGGAPPQAPTWQTCRIEGLRAGSGLAVFEDELVVVAGGDDRNVYAIPRAALVPNGSTHARGLLVDVKDDSFLSGAESFAEQGYQFQHLWKLPLDFQAVATRPPNFVFLGDRTRRVIFWGRLIRDASGRLARARLDRLVVAPGATRSDAKAGDWRDKGPGLCGLVAPTGQRTEDLYLVDRGEIGRRFVRVRKTDMYGSVLGGLLLETSADEAPDINALAWHAGEVVLQRGEGRGRQDRYRESVGAQALSLEASSVGPTLPAGQTWSGMGYAPDGTLYLVSDGTPALVAWRRP